MCRVPKKAARIFPLLPLFHEAGTFYIAIIQPHYTMELSYVIAGDGDEGEVP